MTKTNRNNSSCLIDQFRNVDSKNLLSISKPYKRSFYERDTIKVAREILGSILIHELNGESLAGFIVEAEAYKEEEPACHAHRGKTPRCEIMFGPGGMAYIYFVYGMYWCLNATTEKEGRAGAVLIRAIEPFSGIQTMKRNRTKDNLNDLCSGPGKLTVAYQLDRKWNGWDLSKPPFRILEVPDKIKPKFKIDKTKRIGLEKAKDLEFRFCVSDNPFVSKR